MRQYPIISLLVLCSFTCGVTACGSVENSEYDDAQSELQGQSALSGVTIQRSGNDFQLSWSGNVNKVKIYEGTNPDAIDNLILTVRNASSALITGLDPARRHYFRLKAGGGHGTVIAERGLPQANVSNLRDIGGYNSTLHQGELTVAWGQFLRSGSIGANANTTFLGTLGIKTVIDTRNPVELQQQGPPNVPGATIIHSPIWDAEGGGADPVSPHFCFPGNQTPECYAAQEVFFGPNGENMRALKLAGFRSLITGVGPHPFNFGDTVRDAIRILLQTMADQQKLPLVWADTAGEGRTGVGAAMAELILGVPEDQVIADYALSTQFRQPLITAQVNQLVASGLLKKAAYILPQLTAEPIYMEAILDQLHTSYGSAIDYAHSLGITDDQIEQARQNLLRK